jgi:hypothetical protein
MNAETKTVRYRVRKDDVQIQPIPKQDGLDVCLECWKLWMGGDDRDLSASRMQLGSGRDGEEMPEGYESNPYDEQRIADMRIGEATGAMIEDLKPVWRWAIYKKCGISTVWNFRSADFLSCLVDGQAELESKLRNHIATATQFL